MNSLRIEATKLRDSGYSYNMIKEELGVSISTMSYWFSDRPFTPNDITKDRIKTGVAKLGIARHNNRVEDTISTILTAQKEIGKLSNRDLWLLGLGLYIGEGSKSIESTRIVNSDPDVIQVSIRWFKEVCGLEDSNIILSLNIYPDIDEHEAISYWSNITGLPITNFRKTQIDTRKNKTSRLRRKLPYGTLQIRIKSNGNPEHGVKLFRRIKGWTKGVLLQV
jgi:hypothetical protein